MKKIFLIIVAVFTAFLFNVPITAQDAMVNNLKLESDGQKLTFQYTSNVYASAMLLFLSDGVVIDSLVVNPAVVGVNKIVLNEAEVPIEDNTINWGIRLYSANYLALEDLTSNEPTEKFHFYSTQGVVVDNNPKSPGYGRTYVVAAMDGASDGASDRADTQKRGIFVYDKDLQELNPVANVGILPANAASLMTATTRYAMHRLAINPKTGHIAFTYDIEGATAIWSMDPTNLAGDAINLIEGLPITRANALCFDSYGSLYIMDHANIDTGGTLVKVVNNTFDTIIQSDKWLNSDMSLTSDGRGGFWISQYRVLLDSYGCLFHVNVNGELDFIVDANADDSLKSMFLDDNGNVSRRGQCAYDEKNDILAFGGNRVVTLFQVSYDKTTGVPSLTKINSTPIIGNNIDGIAFYENGDFAAVSSSSERFVKFAAHETVTAIAPWEQTICSHQLNPFAYALSSELSQDKSQLLVNYSLNARATDVQIVIMDGETAVKTIACDGLSKGSHSIAIPTADLPEYKQLTWKVEVKGAEVTEPTEYAVNYSFYYPSAVDIDNNPENPTFGMILTNEGMRKVKDIEGYLSTGYGAGIYAFNPAFEPMPNGSNPGYNGGIEFTDKRADAPDSITNGYTAYSPYRIRISEDGRIFVTSLNTDGNYLWEVNPNNLDEWTPVFQGTLNDNKELVDAGGNFIAAPNIGFDVKGTGEDLQLMMYSANLSSITSAAMGGFRCDEYNLGTATSWATAPSKVWENGKYIRNYLGTQVVYDNEGGIWIASYRGTATNDSPGLVHINKDGVEDLKLLWSNIRQAGIRFNNDFTKLVVAGNNGAPKKATIYAVSKDANGAPVLTEETVIDMAILGNNINDFAFDYAGNLYACSNSLEKIVAWAMPRSADEVVTTPAASKYSFVISDGNNIITYTSTDGNIVTPYATDVFGVNIVSNVYENGVGTITFDGIVKSIGGYAFHDCDSLSSIIIPNSVKTIGYGAFSGCVSLDSIIIGSGVSTIGDDVFGGCGALTSIVVDANNATFDSREDCNAIIRTANNILVAGCKMTVIPNTVKGIGNYAFAGSWDMTSIEIPYGVETIGSSAFGGCTLLRSVTLPSSIVTIGNDAFSTCPALTSITIPNTVERIGDYAFWCDYALDTINIETVTPPSLGYNPFYNVSVSHCFVPCGVLDAYKASAWANYMSEFIEECDNKCGNQLYWFYNKTELSIIGYGAMYDYTSWTLPWQQYTHQIQTISLPEGMTTIGTSAFADCKYVRSMVIPASIEKIDDSAFENCRMLSTLTFANGGNLTYIGNWAFYNNHELKNVIIPEGVTEIGYAAFYGCTYLDEISLPESMQYIGDNGFALCAKLRCMNVSATTPPTVEARTFEDVDRSIPVYVPTEAVGRYRTAPVWEEFNIVGKNNAPTLVENILTNGNTGTKKLLRNGQLLILRDGKTYNIMGAEIK